MWKNKCIAPTDGSHYLVTMAQCVAIMLLLMDPREHILTTDTHILFREQRARETERPSPFSAPQDSVFTGCPWFGLHLSSPPSRALPSHAHFPSCLGSRLIASGWNVTFPRYRHDWLFLVIHISVLRPPSGGDLSQPPSHSKPQHPRVWPSRHLPPRVTC